MSPSGAELFRQIKSRITEVDPADVREQMNNGAAVVDVREAEELQSGKLPGAKHVPRGYLESRIEGAVPDHSQHVVLYCASGNRSAYAARTLIARNVFVGFGTEISRGLSPDERLQFLSGNFIVASQPAMAR